MTAALEGGEWSAARPGRLYPQERPGTHFTEGCVAPGPIRLVENLVPTGIRFRTGHPEARSLYQLSYPAHKCVN